MQPSDTTTIEELRDALHDAAERLFAIAEDMGCDAGNFDGGSSASCEHCRILGHANFIERLLKKPVVLFDPVAAEEPIPVVVDDDIPF